jgi:hypothetical protein
MSIRRRARWLRAVVAAVLALSAVTIIQTVAAAPASALQTCPTTSFPGGSSSGFSAGYLAA